MVVNNKGEQIVVPSIFKKYRKSVDGQIIRALSKVDEITVIGYSLPPYDYDFKYLLLKGLIKNKNRDNIPIKIIDKVHNDAEKEKLLRGYKYLAAEPEFISKDGFLNYLSKNNSSDG